MSGGGIIESLWERRSLSAQKTWILVYKLSLVRVFHLRVNPYASLIEKTEKSLIFPGLFSYQLSEDVGRGHGNAMHYSLHIEYDMDLPLVGFNLPGGFLLIFLFLDNGSGYKECQDAHGYQEKDQ